MRSPSESDIRKSIVDTVYYELHTTMIVESSVYTVDAIRDLEGQDPFVCVSTLAGEEIARYKITITAIRIGIPKKDLW